MWGVRIHGVKPTPNLFVNVIFLEPNKNDSVVYIQQ